MGLERVPKFEEALLLEFGRGFRYTRPLRVNVMDLDYELMEELVGSKETRKMAQKQKTIPPTPQGCCSIMTYQLTSRPRLVCSQT